METDEAALETDKSQPQKPSTPPEDQAGDGNDDAKSKAPVRKRTKTGCLTCRKRRIKCDENRPFCNNCKKSKRNCEGYNQRLVFKDPVDPYTTHYHNHVGYTDQAAHMRRLAESPASSSHGSHPLIAPKPPPVDRCAGHYSHSHGYPTPSSATSPQGFNFNQPFGSLDSIQAQQASVHMGTEADLRRHGGPLVGFPPPLFTDGMAQSPARATSSEGYSSFPRAPPPRPSISEAVQRHERLVAEPYDPPIDVDMDVGDDEYLGESEDEEIVEVERRGESIYGAVVDGRGVSHLEANDAVMRSFSAYAEGKTLTTYQPTAHTSPLNDPRTLAVFRHFVFVTGPSMSLYERHPFDHSKISPTRPAPQTNQNIWTYTFPILSLNHPALLQAMLALGSLQIANLQRVPATAAMKHYHLAIRRISKNVQDPEKRKHPATLAATLLLSYFEVWSSDHNKWCKHLCGARILFREVDFTGKSRRCLPAKRLQRRQLDKMQRELDPYFLGYGQPDTGVVVDEFEDVDIKILSHIAGLRLNPDDYGVGIEVDDTDPNPPTDREMELYEHERDLFWWNCKMDVYQSILGGTRLFMRFKDWLPCPPRAPIGRLDAIFGTFDHVLLLLARLCEFVSNDLARKRKVSKGMPGGPPSGSPPMFPGMFPTIPTVTVPKGFTDPGREPSPQSDNIDDADLETATKAAIQEWESIRDAFEILESRFGPEFQPLAAEFADQRHTPFGPALQFRTYSVAGVWMNLYMGKIHLHRGHPSMPPAAMMAAGRAMKETYDYAQMIGRIAAGLSDDVSMETQISTQMGAAFMECCFPLFVAGIQYQDGAQRIWLVQMLLDIARLTGWHSARQIAQGCESAWVKGAHMGRGPPYIRSPELSRTPQSVWTNPRRIDRRFQELNEGHVLVLAKTERADLAMGLLGVEEDLDKLSMQDD